MDGRDWTTRRKQAEAVPSFEDAQATEREGIIRYAALIVVIFIALTAAPAQAHHRRHDRYWYEYSWQEWLPAKWQRIARCETGITWTWNSGTYQGAFGFYWGSWDAFKPRGAPAEAYQATPRQQYQAAMNIYRRYGYSAWGCGGA